MTDHQAETDRRVADELRREAATMIRLADRIDPPPTPTEIIHIDEDLTPERAAEIRAAFAAVPGSTAKFLTAYVPHSAQTEADMAPIRSAMKGAVLGSGPVPDKPPPPVDVGVLGDTRPVSKGALMVADERYRQITGEGYDPMHDAGHTTGELAWAAACYVTRAADPDDTNQEYSAVPTMWPWADREWKPKPDRVRNLVVAAALIVAEIDRTLTQETP